MPHQLDQKIGHRLTKKEHTQRVLFIEDDEDFAGMMAPLIERELNAHVIRARDPYEAINLFADGYYDLVVLDWNLQDLTGKDTLKNTENILAAEPELPRQWEESQVPVIILSGHDRKSFKDINGGFFRFAGAVSKRQSLAGILTSLKLINAEIKTNQEHEKVTDEGLDENVSTNPPQPKSTPHTIFSLIHEDHQELRDFIRLFKKESVTPDELKEHLPNFVSALEGYVKAKQRSLYDGFRDFTPVRKKIAKGEIEHSVADALAFEIHDYDLDERSDFMEIAAKAKVLAELVELHINEEEKDLLAELRNHMSTQESQELGMTYLEVKTALEPRTFDVFARSAASL